MMRTLIILGSIISILAILSLLFVYSWIGDTVKENIATVKEQHTGNTEDALIAYLLDENIPTEDRTHIAIWTIGQIKSEKALPILRELYKNDPEGKSCYGNHNEYLCQYEVYKAITAIENNRLFSYARLRTR